MKFWLVLTFCFSLVSIYGQNPHDTPTTAFPLTITPTDTLNYITKDNINAQIEADGTPQACGSSLEYDVFGKIQTDANTTDFTIHFQNIDPSIFLTVQLLDENGNQITCTFIVGSGSLTFPTINPNSTYYIKLLDGTYDGLQEGNFDIAVTSNTVLPIHQAQIIAHVIPRNKKIIASITNMNGQQLATQTLHVGANYHQNNTPSRSTTHTKDYFVHNLLSFINKESKFKNSKIWPN